ncbi:MAG: hypothetical protein J6D34_07430 [Atopobiaceae bacterium]|nr:hypothetical protein [Atopobiaceae bacterium]
MSKSASATATSKSFANSKPSRTSQKVRWHAFGMGKEDRRDPAALTFARLGLLATRW